MYWVWELISIHEILSATKYAALFDKPIKRQHVINILWSIQRQARRVGGLSGGTLDRGRGRLNR